MAETERKKEFLRALKFLFFSVSAGIIQAGSTYLLETFTHLPSWACYLIGLILSVIWNFTLNRKFTFKSQENIPRAMLKVALFYAVFTPISTFGVRYLTDRCGWNAFFADALMMVINLVTEFLYQRFVVFKNSIDTAGRSE